MSTGGSVRTISSDESSSMGGFRVCWCEGDSIRQGTSMGVSKIC